MDENQLIAHSRARLDHAAAKRVLKEKYQAKMLFAYRDGMWRAGPDLHAMITLSGHTGPIVLLDLYENPVLIDPAELLAISQQRWQEQMTAWHLDYQILNQKR